MDHTALPSLPAPHSTSQTGSPHEHTETYAVLGCLVDAVYCVDPAGRITFANAAFTSMTGYTLADLLGTPSTRLYVPEADALFRARRHQVYNGAAVPTSVETILLRHDGTRLPVELTVSSHRTAEGQIVGRIGVLRDLSARRHIDDTLRASEERFRLIAQASRDVLWEIDLATQQVWWSPAMTDVLGWPPEEIGPDTAWCYAHMHPEDRARIVQGMEAALASDARVWHDAFRYQTKDRGYAYVVDRATIVRDASGQALRMVGAMTDVTERHRAEQARRASEARLRALAEAVPAMMWACHPDGTVVYLNQRWMEYTGQTLDTAQGYGWAATMHPEDRLPILAQWERCTRTGERYEGEVRYRGADGQYRWHYFRGVPVRSDDGRISAWYGISVDIQARKEAEEALRESDARFQLLANAAPVLIWVHGPDGCAFVNRPYLAFLGVSNESDVRGDRWMAYLHPDDREAYGERYRAAMAARAPFAAQGRFRRADGVYRWFQSVGTPRLLPDDTFLGYVGCSFDITEQHEAEAVLAQRVAERATALEAAMAAQQRLEREAQRAEHFALLGRLAAGVSHELRNPLAAVFLHVDVLTEELQQPSPQSAAVLAECLAGLKTELARLDDLVQDYLSLVRVHAIRCEVQDLGAAVTAWCRAFQEAVAVHGVALQTEGVTQLGPVAFHGSTLRRALHNLVQNAAEAMPQGGTITVAGQRTADQVQLAVRDTGHGIPAARLAHIFDPLHTTKPGGTGLGLYIVQQVIMAHGGQVTVQSREGHGTTVTLTLPCASAAAPRQR